MTIRKKPSENPERVALEYWEAMVVVGKQRGMSGPEAEQFAAACCAKQLEVAREAKAARRKYLKEMREKGWTAPKGRRRR